MTGRDRAGEILTELSTTGVHLSEPVGLGFDEAYAFHGRFHRNSGKVLTCILYPLSTFGQHHGDLKADGVDIKLASLSYKMCN